MVKDKEVTEVIFRFDKEFGVYAIFPYQIETFQGEVNSYAHIGQHMSVDYDNCVRTSRPATESEYRNLFNELENSIGYNLKVIAKRSRKRYIAELLASRK